MSIQEERLREQCVEGQGCLGVLAFCATLSGQEEEVAQEAVTHQQGADGHPLFHPTPQGLLYRHPGTLALGGTLSEEMGAFGCLALELGEAALKVRTRNHRPNWPGQEGHPEPLKAGLLNSCSAAQDCQPCS